MRSISPKYGRLSVCISPMKPSRMADGGVDTKIPSGASGEGAFGSANPVR